MPFTTEEINSLRDYARFTVGTSFDSGILPTERPRKEPQGLFLKTIDYLNRPLYASAGFSNAIVQGKGMDEAINTAIKGFIGKERVFYSDVLKSAGVKNKYVRGIAGFALDVGLDFVTYITFGMGGGTKLGLTTLNKSGTTLLSRLTKRQLPKLTKRFLTETASKEIAEKIARETIEEAVLRMAFKEPQKYMAKSAVRWMGKEIPVLSDVYRLGGKMVSGAGELKPLKYLSNKLEPMTKWAGEAFIGDNYIIKHAKDLDPLQKSLLVLYRQQAKERIFLGSQLAMEKATQMATDVPNVADRELISNAIEQAGKRFIAPTKEAFFVRDLVPERLMDKADEISKFIYKEITEPEARKGLLATFKEGYVPHYYKKKVAGLLGKDVPHPMIARNRAGRMRVFQTMDDAINAGWQPIEDYSVSLGIRNAYSKRVIAIDDYVQRMLSTTGKPLSRTSTEWKEMLKLNRVPEGFGVYMPRNSARFYPLFNSTKTKTIQVSNSKAIKKLFDAEGIIPFRTGELLQELRLTPVKTAFKVSDDIPVYLLPKDVAEMMNKSSPYFSGEKNFNKLLQAYDKVMSGWKASVTVYFPGFHARNAESNLWLMFLGGFKNPMRIKDSFKVQMYGYLRAKGKTPKDFIVKLGGKDYMASELYQTGTQTGVLSRGWFGAELGKTIEQRIMRETGIKPRLTGKQKGMQLARDILIEKPRGVGVAVENNARLALFLDQLDKGINIDQAVRHTKKFLFDYGELTDFEKSTMKRIVPFYTWLRKNIPLEVEQLFKQPGKFAMIGKTKEEVESLSTRPDERFLPEWMREKEMFIRLPSERKDKPMYVNPDFAFQDLAKLHLTNPDVLREWWSSLSPVLKAPFEILSNYNMFFGRNIVDPNLPEERQFRESLKEELMNNMRITGYVKRLTKEDLKWTDYILDAVLGLKLYPYDESQERYWYYQRQQREDKALRKLQQKKKK